MRPTPTKRSAKGRLTTMSLPRSRTAEEMYASLIHRLGQQILPDAEMRAHGYSEKAIASMSATPTKKT